MSFEIIVSPSGRLSIERAPEQAPSVDEKWINRIETAFSESAAAGLVLLAADAGSLSLPPSPAYWRDFARLYLQRLCQTSGAVEGAAPVLPVPAEPELVSFVQQAPPMRGGEFLGPELLASFWSALGEFLREQTTASGFAAWLKSHGSQWHAVGRVTFHLAENKRDPERPFAFLATYVHRLSEQGKPQHLPLSKALQEYAGTEHKAELANLLEPVRRAGEKSVFVRELLESRRIFQPLAWTPGAAHRFLREIPHLEESGLLVRLPDWWKSGRPSRAQVKVTIGDQRTTALGLDALLDFSVEVALDGEPLTMEEWEKVTSSQENLVLLKGKWVEVDRDRLKQVLEQWKQVQKQGGAVSFLEGMRMLSGLGKEGGEQDPLADPETRDWSQIVAGDWLQKTLQSMRDPSTIGGFDPERGVRASLRPYQKTGVHWLWFMTSLGLGACLADDMGLGKTLQTIALLVQLKQKAADERPSLLVAPASLLANWKNEITRFAPDLSFVFAHPSEIPATKLKEMGGDPASAFEGKDLVVTTYGLLTRLDWLRKVDWRLVVLDEAQAIKNPGARQSKAVKQLHTRARVALTGTPVENRLGDLWSLFDFLCPGLLGGAKEFGRTVKQLAEDKDRHFAPLRQLTQPYILRRLKTDKRVIADLPDKTELTAWCTLTKAQAVLYENSVSELAKKLQELTGIERRGLILAFLVRFKQICNHPSHWLGDNAWEGDASGKFVRVRELAEEIASRQEKVLVFTQFREMTGPLAAYLEQVFHRPGLVLHGSTPVKERQRLVAQFQEDDGPPFFILSLKAGGTGLNLTAASHVIHFDRWWNPAVENQATDRAFRIGQKRNVLVHKFVCRGTIEERIDKLIEEKKGLAKDVLESGGGGEQLLTEMPDDELLRFVSLDLSKAVQD